eukprot:5587315-Amphidinium_carterae.2
MVLCFYPWGQLSLCGNEALVSEACVVSRSDHHQEALTELRLAAVECIDRRAARMLRGTVQLDQDRIRKGSQIVPALLQALGNGGSVLLVNYVSVAKFPWVVNPDKALKPSAEWPQTMPK